MIACVCYCARSAFFTTNDLAFAPAGSLGNLGGIGSGLKTFLQSSESTILLSGSVDVLDDVQCWIDLLGLLLTVSSLGTATKVSTLLSHGMRTGLELRR